MKISRSKKILIIGCGRIGSGLANQFALTHNVFVVDSNPDALKSLGSSFNGTKILGSGTNQSVWEENNFDNIDILYVLTNSDEANILIGIMAKDKFKIPDVTIKVMDDNIIKILKRSDIRPVPKLIF